MLSSVACPVLQYFSSLSHKRHDFRRQIIEYKTCCNFSLQILSETFLILRRSERDMKTCKLAFMYSTCYSCQILMNLEFSRQGFEKLLNVKFHADPLSGSRVVPFGRTDVTSDMTKLIVALRNFANASKNQ